MDAGMPVVSRGKTRGGVVIDRVEADPWVATRRGAEKADSARTNVATEQAEKLRIANARSRRELILFQEVQFVFHEACATLVQGCEAMPQRVSPDPEVQCKVRDECRALRGQFAERLEALAGVKGDLPVGSRDSTPAPRQNSRTVG
jgi:hypothetical protein